MSIYFLRHLKTESNCKSVISGSGDSASLCENQEIIYPDSFPEKFDIVLCSTLKRCKDTLNQAEKVICNTVIYSEKLIERNMGILEGMQKDKAKEMYPHLFHNDKVDVNAIIPDGESIDDVKMRLTEIAALIRNNQDKEILICSHNQALKILFSVLKNITVTNHYWNTLNFRNGHLISIDKVTY